MPRRAVKEQLLRDVATWQADGLISEGTRDQLNARWDAPGFGLMTMIKYVGVVGAVIAGFGIIGTIVVLVGSELFGAVVTLVVAGGLFVGGLSMASSPEGGYEHSSKLILTLALIGLVGSISLGADAFDLEGDTIVILTGFVTLPVTLGLAYRFRNTYLLILGLMGFFHWVGSFTSMLGRSTYALSVQDPRLMVLVAAFVVATGLFHERNLRKSTGRFFQAWEATGLVYFNLSLLILSIYPREPAIYYAIVWAIAGIVQIVFGARLHNSIFVGFGVTAISINIFTRYSENLWDKLDVGVFFLIGGALLFAASATLELLLRKKVAS